MKTLARRSARFQRPTPLRSGREERTLIAHLAPKVPQLSNFKLRHVDVTLREAQDDDTFHVQGTYEAIIQLTNREKKDAGPFDLYIARERTDDTVSWFLVFNERRELLVTNPA